MTRTGKIARLPRALREELNVRLLNNEPGPQILAWLNALPDVRAVLTAQFDGRDINEQNLSDWRNGGYEDWLRFQETHDWIRSLVDRSTDIQAATNHAPVSDILSGPIAIVLGKAIQFLSNEDPTNLAYRQHIIAFTRELSLLRQGDHKAQFLRLQRDRFEASAQAKSS